MSKVVEVNTLAELGKLVSENENVVVDFAAPSWCIPCQRLAGPYAMAAAQNEDAVYATVDIDDATEGADFISKFDIRGVPTLKVFKSGEFVRDLPTSEHNMAGLVNATA